MVKWGIGEFEMPLKQCHSSSRGVDRESRMGGKRPSSALHTDAAIRRAGERILREAHPIQAGRCHRLPALWTLIRGRHRPLDDCHCDASHLHALPSQIIDFLLFVVLPYLPCCGSLSKVYSIKRAEHVSRVRSFAQLGLKAAVAVEDFKCLDVDDRGFIEVKDLASVFGKIPTIDKSNALLIGQAIMRACKGKEKRPHLVQ